MTIAPISEQTRQRPRIGYVISNYPKISHTFIQREVLGLRDAGHDIATFSVVRAEDDEVLSPTDEVERQRTTSIRPLGVRAALSQMVRPALLHPKSTVAAAAMAFAPWWGHPRELLWRGFYLAEALVLWSQATERGVQHLHAHHANVASDVARLAAAFGRLTGQGPTTWSFTMHGSSEFLDVERHDLGAKASDAIAVACISEFTKSQLMMLTDPKQWDRFSVIHCGVDPSTFVPTTSGSLASKAKWEVPNKSSQDFTVLYVGRLGSEKGLPVMVEALGLLRASLSDREVRFLVVGEGELRSETKRRCLELGVKAEFAGAVGQHEILNYYHRADAFCLASFREGIPVVLMEAMSCELPCVAPRITAIPELIENGTNGLTVTAGRADELAERLHALASDSEYAAQLGAAARQSILSGFTTNQTVEGMRDFFDNVAELRLAMPGNESRSAISG